MLDIENPASVGNVNFAKETVTAFNNAAHALNSEDAGSRTGAQHWLRRVGELDARVLLGEASPEVARAIGESLVGNLDPGVSELYVDGFGRGINAGPLPEGMVVFSDTMIVSKEELAV